MHVLHKNKKEGFTLVEMLVSVGIFTIVMTIAIGALLVVYDTYRKTRTLKNVMENVNIASESMIKKIRTGSNIRCSGGATYCSQIQFIGKDNVLYSYRFYNGAIEQCSDTTFPPLSSCPVAKFSPITSSDVRIMSLLFYTYGIGDSQVQDSVTVLVSGFANVPGNPEYDSRFRIQTTISKRLLDTF